MKISLKVLLFAFILAQFLTSTATRAGDTKKVVKGPSSGGGWQRYVVSAPDVVYPEVLKRTATAGTGTFLLTINPKNGEVTEVKVIKSTGFRLLNGVYVMNFFEWKFRPGTIESAQITRGVNVIGWARDYHTGRH